MGCLWHRGGRPGAGTWLSVNYREAAVDFFDLVRRMHRHTAEYPASPKRKAVRNVGEGVHNHGPCSPLRALKLQYRCAIESESDHGYQYVRRRKAGGFQQ